MLSHNISHNPMKIKLLLYCIFISITLFSCYQEQEMTDVRYPGLELMIDGYYNHYYEFPNSLDSLISVMESREQYVDSSFLSCYKLTLYNLKQDKKNIRWQLSEEDFLNKELLVIKGKDTLVRKVNNLRFPCLGLLLDGFKDCYYDYPSTLFELLDYCQAIGYIKEEPLRGCDSVTINNLVYCENNGLLKWTKDDNGLLIMIRDDTLNYVTSWSPCSLKPFDKKGIRFYDLSGVIVISEEMKIEFNKGINNIRIDYPVIQENNHDYHILQYQKQKGICLYCKEDLLPLDLEWYQSVEDFVMRFADENNLGKIVFGVKYCQKR